MALNERDQGVLAISAICQYLTVKQITWFAFDNEKTAGNRVRFLIDHGYLDRFPNPFSQEGRPEQMIHLNAQRLSETLNLINMRREHVVSKAPKDRSLLLHLSGINNFRAALHRACKNKGLKYTFLAEYEKGHSNQFERCLQEYTDHIPDAVFTLQNYNEQRALFFLEWDTGTEPISRSTGSGSNIVTKIHEYQDLYSSRGFEKYSDYFKFPFKGFRVLFVTSSIQRLEHIAETEESGAVTGLVWLSTKEQINPESILEKIWQVPGYSKKLQSILRHREKNKCQV